MTAYDETRCYGVVGTAQTGPLYCGSPAKRKDNYGRPLCGRCKDPKTEWNPAFSYPRGLGYYQGVTPWKFFRNPPALKPWALTVANVTKGLDEAGVSASDVMSGLKARKRYEGGVAVDYRVRATRRDGLNPEHVAAQFAKARDALAARGLTLVMVDDRHATVTETKP